MATTRTHATLRVFSPDGLGSAAAVTAALGIGPTASHEQGERRSDRDPRPWTNALWSLESPLPWDRPLTDHLAHLCDLVESRGNALADLAAEGYRLDWFCFVEVEGGQGGVLLDPKLLRRLAALPVELDLDIYASADTGG